MNRLNKTLGVVYSSKEKEKSNQELISQYDRRINDMLHKIEFTNVNPNQAYKMYMKLQGFLRKKRDLKKSRQYLYSSYRNRKFYYKWKNNKNENKVGVIYGRSRIFRRAIKSLRKFNE